MTCCQSVKDRLPASYKGSAERWELMKAIWGPGISKGLNTKSKKYARRNGTVYGCYVASKEVFI